MTGHVLIARLAKIGQAKARLEKAGICAQGYPAITPPPFFGSGVFAKGYARFGGGEISKDGGPTRSGPVSLGGYGDGAGGWRGGMGREWVGPWVGLWEEDADAEPGMGRGDLELPTDCGAIYLGGILWGFPTHYKKQIGERLWQVTEEYPISATRGDSNAQWSTRFVWPWMAWQIDRRETWPR